MPTAYVDIMILQQKTLNFTMTYPLFTSTLIFLGIFVPELVCAAACDVGVVHRRLV